MDDTNKRTIESYNAGVRNFVENTQDKAGDLGESWIYKSLESLTSEAKILEIGSAYGRDAKLIEEKGFKVEKTDAAQGFVDILQKDDSSAHKLNVLTDELDSDYDLILANAVFLHFNTLESEYALRKVFDAVKSGGTFAFSLKQGDGEEWKDNKGLGPRYFKYWSEEAIVDLLTKIGFSDIDAWTDEPDSSGSVWIKIIAKKSS